MNKLKKVVAATTLAIMTLSSLGNNLDAQSCDYVTSAGGASYEEASCCPSYTPYIVLGTVAIVAIIAIAVRHHHHHHNHSHCH